VPIALPRETLSHSGDFIGIFRFPRSTTSYGGDCVPRGRPTWMHRPRFSLAARLLRPGSGRVSFSGDPESNALVLITIAVRLPRYRLSLTRAPSSVGGYFFARSLLNGRPRARSLGESTVCGTGLLHSRARYFAHAYIPVPVPGRETRGIHASPRRDPPGN